MSENRQKISRERRKELLKRLKDQIGPHQKTLYIIAGLSFVQFLMRVISFALIAKMLEQLYLSQPIAFLETILLVIALNVIGLLCALSGKKYQGVVSQYARNQLKKQFFEAFDANSGHFDEQTSTTDVLMIASSGIDTLDTYYSVYLNQQLRAITNCLTVLAIVAWLFPLGSLVFLISLPFIPVSIILIQKKSKQIMAHYWATYMDVGNLFMDDLQGLNTLYSYEADEIYEKTFLEKAEAFRQSTMTLLSFQLQSVGYMDGVMYVGVALSGFLASQAFLQGQLSLFAVIFFVLIASEFFAPIREAGYGMHLVMMNTKMADRIFTFLDSVTPPANEVENSALDKIEQLTFSRASIGYAPDQPLIQQIDATLRTGELFAVAGVSGQGKTTLAKTLKKQVDLLDGSIYLNELELTNVPIEQLTQQIVHISANSYVFRGSILDNLTMGQVLSESDVLNYLAKHQLLHFVNDLPDGLHTQVGENGQLLSPGQRQQILCVRAMLGNYSVYIFDEMTASVDKDNEVFVMDLLKQLAKTKLVIFISHKMKQVMQADKILFLHDATYTLGTPEDLLKNKAFHDLLQTQAELEAIFDAN